MKSLPKTLIFLGPQGSGKDTQARFLTEEFGYSFIGAGSTLREIAQQDTELGREVKETIDDGNLVQPELITRVLRERLAGIAADKHLIIEGYPRTISQFQLFNGLLSDLGRDDYLTLYFDITDEEAMRRLAKRAETEARADDTEEAIKKRLKWSRKEVDRVVAEMEKEGKVIRIDGMPSIEEIHQEVVERLGLK